MRSRISKTSRNHDHKALGASVSIPRYKRHRYSRISGILGDPPIFLGFLDFLRPPRRIALSKTSKNLFQPPYMNKCLDSALKNGIDIRVVREITSWREPRGLSVEIGGGFRGDTVGKG